VVGLDFNREMLSRAMWKKLVWQQRLRYSARRRGRTIDRIDLTFILADAANLPIRDGCVDRVRTSFSFRNLIYKNPMAKAYLREIVRVLQRKGKFVCVETSQPTDPFVRALFHFYCLRIVPLIGWLISGSRGAYKYLGMSAASFPDAQNIVSLVKKSGFQSPFFKRFSLGIVALYIATGF
jgi:demethylmenaquinone methyltransferase/2-methoxy-6-polyprenyl-1,4-benzoquinol methylase